MTPRLLITCFVLALAVTAAPAQTNAPPRQGPPQKGPPNLFEWQNRWGVGLGAAYSTEPYEGYDYYVMAFPMVTYFGPRFTWTGPTAAYRIFRHGPYSCRASVRYDFSGYDEDDADVFDGMDARRGSVLAGLSARYALGQRLGMRISAAGDCLNVHNGETANVSLSRGYWWKGLLWAPGIGASWMSADMADYYYGVESDEATADRPAYELDDTINWTLGLFVTYPHSERIMLIVSSRLELLDPQIQDSPLVNEDLLVSGFLGASYRL